ncbi:MAG TPA: sulfite exporter TauE/SafE family protein [Dermatophilaceae bacterium]|nr:sulfite exporter TauE/SafE family protein [Dermatophilaceae bacterium]
MSWWIVPVALTVGAVMGALGGGGAILTVPILVYLFGQPATAATTGSLIIVGLTATVGMLAHARGSRIRAVEGATFGVLGIGGTYLGSRLSANIPEHLLLSLFALLMLLVAGLMLRSRRRSRAAADHAPADTASVALPGRRWSPAHTARVLAAATGVGLLTGFFGVGGGFAVVPVLVLVLGFRMPQAVATSLLVIAINSATALLARAGSTVALDWGLLGAFSAVAVLGSFLGARIGRRVSPDSLTIAFVTMLVLVAGYMAVMNIPHLVSGAS